MNIADTLNFDDVTGAIHEEESMRKNKEERPESSKHAEALKMTKGISTKGISRML